MPTTVDGIVSGLDTTSLIKAVLTPYTVSLNTLKGQSEDASKQRDAVAGVKNTLVALSNAIKAMDTPQEFRSAAATTSSKQFTATADSTAVAGTYAVKVDHLATAQITVSSGVADKTAAAFGTGTLAVTVGGQTTNLTLDNTNNSLTGVAAALNQVSGLSAYVLDTGNVNGRYQLVVQGTATGAANAFGFDTSGLTGTVPTFTDKVDAVDASVDINGVTVQSASNTLTAVPGLTLSLTQAGTAADNVVVAADPSGMAAKLQKVVDAYNAALDYYSSMSVYNPTENLKGPLIGEGSTRRALQDLAGTVTNRFNVAGSAIGSLAELGVKTGQDGHLSLDVTILKDKLAADPNGVTTFLTSTGSALASVRDKIDNLYVDEDSGSLTSTVNGLADTVSQIEDNITRTTDRMNSESDMLRARFTAMETILGQLKNTSSYLTSVFSGGSSSSSSSKK